MCTVAAQLAKVAVKHVIFKMKSQFGRLKQKSASSQAKINLPQKPGDGPCGMVQLPRRYRFFPAQWSYLIMTNVHSIGPDVAGSRIFRIFAFLYGIAAYFVFFATILYAIGFVMGLVVPKTIDTGTETSAVEALVINLLLMALFAIQHSVMARKRFKTWWTQYIPKPIERSTYVLLASLSLLLLFWQWRPM